MPKYRIMKTWNGKFDPQVARNKEQTEFCTLYEDEFDSPQRKLIDADQRIKEHREYEKIRTTPDVKVWEGD